MTAFEGFKSRLALILPLDCSRRVHNRDQSHIATRAYDRWNYRHNKQKEIESLDMVAKQSRFVKYSLLRMLHPIVAKPQNHW